MLDVEAQHRALVRPFEVVEQPGELELARRRRVLGERAGHIKHRVLLGRGAVQMNHQSADLEKLFYRARLDEVAKRLGRAPAFDGASDAVSATAILSYGRMPTDTQTGSGPP